MAGHAQFTSDDGAQLCCAKHGPGPSTGRQHPACMQLITLSSPCIAHMPHPHGIWQSRLWSVTLVAQALRICQCAHKLCSTAPPCIQTNHYCSCNSPSPLHDKALLGLPTQHTFFWGPQVLQAAAFLLPNQDLAVVGAIAYMVLAFQLGGFFRANADMIAFCRGLG